MLTKLFQPGKRATFIFAASYILVAALQAMEPMPVSITGMGANGLEAVRLPEILINIP